MRYLRIIVFFTCLSLGLVNHLVAQSARLDLYFNNQTLQEVLFELEKEHHVRFSYAQDRLELNKRITIHIQNKPLDEALKTLFEGCNVSYSKIGSQWVLKNGSHKRATPSNSLSSSTHSTTKNLSQAPTTPEKTLSSDISSAKEEPVEQKTAPQKILPSTPIVPLHASEIPTPKMPELHKSIMQRLRSDVNDVFQSWRDRKASGDLRVFQISTFGTRKKNSQKTNIIGFSFAWGIHGSLEGMQASVFGTAVRRNAIGLQAAGLFNGVGQDMMGLQIAGLFNSTKRDVMGMQISGLLNSSNRVMGSQITAGLNFAKGRLMGMQIAGIGNIASESAKSAQIAAGFNLTKEVSNFQASGMYNKAGSVEGVQITGGINEADEVKGVQIGTVNRVRKITGVQIGLINMADTVRGVSLGLINIIQHGGYNRLEVSGGESVHVVASLKMGPRALYHIYQGGFNLWGRAWGLGWGMGSTLTLDRRWNLNIEAVAMHINEDQKWMPVLNLLSQARATFEYNIDKDFSIFVGPTLNVMVSKFVDIETGIPGSSVPMYSIFDITSKNGVNTRFWAGFQTGVRMRLW